MSTCIQRYAQHRIPSQEVRESQGNSDTKTNNAKYKDKETTGIFLLEVTGKIFERLINLRLRWKLDDSSLYSHNQYGYWRGRNTSLQSQSPHEKQESPEAWEQTAQ